MRCDVPRVVGVFNTSPLYAIGLAEALSEYQVEGILDLLAWIERHRGCPVLVGVHDTADLDLLAEVNATVPESIVVTILDAFEVKTVQASLRAGATGAIDVRASAEAVSLAVRGALAHCTVLPTRMTLGMADGQWRARPSSIADDELGWLRALMAGETVAQLGRRVGYSEREMYRRLRRLYARMGVSGRAEALVRATLWEVGK
jgi:DNA-binding NarL/FixJ family response regulator